MNRIEPLSVDPLSGFDCTLESGYKNPFCSREKWSYMRLYKTIEYFSPWSPLAGTRASCSSLTGCPRPPGRSLPTPRTRGSTAVRPPPWCTWIWACQIPVVWMNKQWKIEKVWQYLCCCTADSQTDAAHGNISSTAMAHLFVFPWLMIHKSIKLKRFVFAPSLSYFHFAKLE